MENKILITKDAFRRDYLPCYGNQYWKTPNIDELASKGTIFNKHYAAGTSTAMSVTSMFTGKNSFELNRKKYDEVEEYNESETLFSEFHKKGYKTYVIWPFEWKELAWKYSKVFPKETTVIGLNGLYQDITINKKRELIKNEKRKLDALSKIIIEIDKILVKNIRVFVWIHLPHVIYGNTCYGSDIDTFDDFIGMIRTKFDDNSIYLSSDHGHMNLEKSIPVYGFHPYQGTICIPLITPKINNQSIIDYATSNTQLKDIILNNNIEKLPYIYSDSQYYLQENRKLAIIKDNYKYIYNKINKTEELYDLDFDPNENVNLLVEKWYDRNRKGYYNLKEIYYYPYWEKLERIYIELKTEKNRIWKEESIIRKYINIVKSIKKTGYRNITQLLLLNKKNQGLFGSIVSNEYYKV